ncbi:MULTISPECIES: hydroxymethylpyrimidine/phosphomethylpyrimidine kinase [unclassified Methylophilus]|jgi:hydroxymethylpyrimidine/phosphomethylpyrimidine kinase|uniref:bifunctional hydroxymethylpyrimidine kinase/phosphomethylpyrimidine kinase n=1 Tax=unclassified Methylophilus TaxID=2630143 RepID=UPI0006F67E4C|nr:MULTISPECIES: hydroxymethylpyrimidine/phosphomethylpyrimidine kinase [unclassified Methylophilus]KQT36500.1 hydroxymethylpyrimidine/phosphomethylpyrimidine kinase [Methylophilus sp. Leaf414]KQT41416.1 hydroxymethylpyrimidine/phosphomethylpyrimidine kinase [Methylophilus sp. Leaf416]KQT57937.1 hydroxymethylpyrimidine/phosphomethylpyrimidine kinase [Methylophilus sp. Leaf459]
MANTPPTVLTFAATDPSSGAGVQADIMALASIGCYPLSVITGITVQDTVGVESVMPLDADWINDQARTILEDVSVSAFKLGLLGSVENVAIIAEIVADYPDVPLIIDPILTSGRGDELSNEEMQAAMCELLFPQATLITPNSLEARRLAYYDEGDEVKHSSLEECALRLLEMGTEYVMITGTHERSIDVVNSLYGMQLSNMPGLIKDYHWERLPGSYHGSGCTLTSAITACLAHGLSIEEAVHEAQEFTWQTLRHSFRPGMGQFIPDRFFWARETEEQEKASELQH